MKVKKLIFGILISASVFFTSCSKEINPEEGIYGPGIFVVNEGAFGYSNGSVSYIPRTTYKAYNDIYSLANENAILGDVVQSINKHDDKFYIVVNNSNYVKVVNAENFKNVATISNRNLPRYIVFNGNRGYLSEWESFTSNGKISVIDLSNNNVVKQIDVGKFPEKMLIHNNQLFVTNSSDTLIHVIDLNNDEVNYTFKVGDWPNSIVKDSNNKIWILCGGIPSWMGSPTAGKLIRFNPISKQIELELTFSSTADNPKHLSINKNGDELYYHFNGGVYKMNISASNLPSTPLFNSSAYGLGVDPSSGYIFVADAGNFTNNGVVRWYNSTGTKIDTAVVGIAPNGFYFWEP